MCLYRAEQSDRIVQWLVEHFEIRFPWNSLRCDIWMKRLSPSKSLTKISKLLGFRDFTAQHKCRKIIVLLVMHFFSNVAQASNFKSRIHTNHLSIMRNVWRQSRVKQTRYGLKRFAKCEQCIIKNDVKGGFPSETQLLCFQLCSLELLFLFLPIWSLHGSIRLFLRHCEDFGGKQFERL